MKKIKINNYKTLIFYKLFLFIKKIIFININYIEYLPMGLFPL